MLIKDQLNREINLVTKPKRWISLVPSISYFIEELYPAIEMIGITKFCDKPTEQRSKIIGGTKNPTIEKIFSLQPDLIIANKEENREEDIMQLAKHFPVYISNVIDQYSMIEMMKQLGQLAEQETLVDSIVNQMEVQYKYIDHSTKIPVCYLIWREPYMSIGHDTFIHSQLESFGFENVFSHYSRYPTVSYEAISEAQPKYIFLSSEPYPFSQKHLQEFEEFEAILVDGRAFSWYGSYLLKTFPYIKALKIKCKPM